MKAIGSLLIVILFVPMSSAFGQETAIVVPASLSDTEGNFAGESGFNRPEGWRLQYVYDASHFGTLTEGERFLTEFRWRPDGAFQGTDSSTHPLRVTLSTTDKNSGSLNRTFSENVGRDETVVFDGEINLVTENIGPPGGPKDFDYVVAFNEPFFYDPTQGNLLVDLVVEGTATDVSLDQHRGLSGVAGFVGHPSDPNAIAGTASDSAWFIPTQFVFIPEPSTALLACLGFLSLLSWRRR